MGEQSGANISWSVASPVLTIKTLIYTFNTLNFRHDKEGVTVHFNLHMDPSKGDATANDVTDVLTTEILTSNSTETESTSSILGDIVIDVQSVNIQGNSSVLILLTELITILSYASLNFTAKN